MKHHDNEEGEHWLSVSDMMSGLMVIFLFIAISYMLKVNEEKNHIQIKKDKAEKIAKDYNSDKYLLPFYLKEIFKNDLKKWNAEVDEDNLSVTFNSPDILFDPGKADIKPQFKAVLEDFFPRYIDVLMDKDFKEKIKEIRIEGHTSSDWAGDTSEASYFKNMALSQERTRATLEYCLSLPQISKNREWIKKILTANGLSSSKLKHKEDNQTEDPVRSRRVEFKIIMDNEKTIQEMLTILQSH